MKGISEMNHVLCKLEKSKREGRKERLQACVSNKLAQTTEVPVVSMVVKPGGNSKEDDASEEVSVSQLQKGPAASLINDGGQKACCAKILFDADERPVEGEKKNEKDGNRNGRNTPLANKIPFQDPNEVTDDAASHDLDGSTEHTIKKAPAYLASLGNGSLDNPVITDDEKTVVKENCKFDPFEVFGPVLDCRIKKLECVVSRIRTIKLSSKAS
ncbi:uncharacterized protein [Spinacia oleracea]|uniref:Uncharacterized protein n=1 Tax=Spinacia oleracea TaxID=3562 RepID=A0ABM3QHZ4_SPIOL|nr:uncharacterized protein LOC130459558 [Spinacia oleracea]